MGNNRGSSNVDKNKSLSNDKWSYVLLTQDF